MSLSEKVSQDFVLWKEQEIRARLFKDWHLEWESSVDREEYDIKMKEISQLEKDLDEIRENMMSQIGN